jgi:hypothetical protein
MTQPDTPHATRTCPVCSAVHPLSVDVCSCDYKFTSTRQSRDTSLGTAGLTLIGLGTLLTLWAIFVLDTTVGAYERVQNIGLLQDQLLFFQAGAASVIVGSIFLAADKVLEALSHSGGATNR